MKKLALVGILLMGGVVAACGALPQVGAVDASANSQQRLFNDVMAQVRANYIRPVNDSEMIDDALQGMLSNLDPHSSYLNAKMYGDMEIATKGEFGGVGLAAEEDDGLIKVTKAKDGMPAANAGIKTDDRISAIDGAPVAGTDFNEALDKMLGAAGSKVTFTILREGEKPFDVTVVRAIVSVEATTYRREGEIGYIRIPGFNERTAEGVEDAVRNLKQQIGPGLAGYVLDLRNNPGGLVEQAVQVSDDFLNSGEIVSIQGRRAGGTRHYDAQEGDIAEGKPVVVLVNGDTASAAEIVSGALQDNKRARIIGMTTFGKGSVQSVIPLGEGRGALRLTTGRYYTPSGHSIQAAGIVPDMQVSQGDETDAAKPARQSEADLRGHLAGESVSKRGNAPVIRPTAGKKYEDFQLAYALDLLRGKMTVGSNAAQSDQTTARLSAKTDGISPGPKQRQAGACAPARASGEISSNCN